jgi:hypothetical protein
MNRLNLGGTIQRSLVWAILRGVVWAIQRSLVWAILRGVVWTIQRSLVWAILRGVVLYPHYNVYDFAEATRIKHISTKLQNKEAKICWLCNRKFMLKKSEGLNINNINFFNRDAVKNYLDNLMLVMEKHNLAERLFLMYIKHGYLTNY